MSTMFSIIGDILRLTKGVKKEALVIVKWETTLYSEEEVHNKIISKLI